MERWRSRRTACRFRTEKKNDPTRRSGQSGIADGFSELDSRSGDRDRLAGVMDAGRNVFFCRLSVFARRSVGGQSWPLQVLASICCTEGNEGNKGAERTGQGQGWLKNGRWAVGN